LAPARRPSALRRLRRSPKLTARATPRRRKPRYKETDHVKAFYQRQPLSAEEEEEGSAMLIKRSERQARRGSLTAALAGHRQGGGLDRRTFLRQSGLVAGSLGVLGALPLGAVRKAEAGPPPKAGIPVELRKNICTHCSVGCTVHAEVQNGVWIGRSRAGSRPINRARTAPRARAVRELVHGRPAGEVPDEAGQRPVAAHHLGQAIDEIGDKLIDDPRAYGPDSVYWLGSAKFSNESAYLNRKFAAFWGTNNVDHQARICHSTTVAGVANTWGYGARRTPTTTSAIRATLIIMGGNPAEAHPVALQHMLAGKELPRAN
jgi:formate dehydrogenase major subunit